MTDREALECALEALVRINKTAITDLCSASSDMERRHKCDCHERAQRALVKIKVHWKPA